MAIRSLHPYGNVECKVHECMEESVLFSTCRRHYKSDPLEPQQAPLASCIDITRSHSLNRPSFSLAPWPTRRPISSLLVLRFSPAPSEQPAVALLSRGGAPQQCKWQHQTHYFDRAGWGSQRQQLHGHESWLWRPVQGICQSRWYSH